MILAQTAYGAIIQSIAAFLCPLHGKLYDVIRRKRFVYLFKFVSL